MARVIPTSTGIVALAAECERDQVPVDLVDRRGVAWQLTVRPGVGAVMESATGVLIHARHVTDAQVAAWAPWRITPRSEA